MIQSAFNSLISQYIGIKQRKTLIENQEKKEAAEQEKFGSRLEANQKAIEANRIAFESLSNRLFEIEQARSAVEERKQFFDPKTGLFNTGG